MPSKNVPKHLKSRFGAGLQCLKRIHLECDSRELADPVDPAQQALFDTGNEVGVLARERFTGGLLISERYYEHPDKRTSIAITNALVPATYEAAFTFQDIRVRVDIPIQNDDGTFDLVEVK